MNNTSSRLNEVYFDNSALNLLWEDTEKLLLKEKFSAYFRLRLGYINFVEIAAIPDEVKRNGIFRLAVKLAQGSIPLGYPITFLKETLTDYHFQAHLTHFEQPTAILKKLDDILKWLQLIDINSSFDERLKFYAKQEVTDSRNWDKGIADARPQIQNALLKMSAKERQKVLRSERAFIKKFIKTGTLHIHIIDQFFQAIPNGQRLKGREIEILNTIDVWAIFTCAFSLMMYNLLCKPEKFSLRRNAGSHDILQSVYLPEVDIFVTADEGQRRLLRIAKQFMSKKTEIISYKEFRRRLLD